MLVYDLQLLLYFLLLSHLMLAVVTVGCVLWLEHRRRLVKLRHLLQANLEHAPVGILFFDGKETYTYANAQARCLLQLPAIQGLLPSAPWIALLDEDMNQIQQDVHAAGRYRTILLPAQAPTADKPQSPVLQWWITPWRMQREPLYLLFVIDQSQQQRLEQQTNLLLGRLAHELRTPLSSIQTHAEILTAAEFADSLYVRSVSFIRSETQRLLQLANKTLEVARLAGERNFDMQALDLLPLVEEVVTQLTPQAQEAAAMMTIEAEVGLPPVMADRSAIKQVLLNLLENAIKHSGADNRIVIQLVLKPTGVECSVRDGGVGVEARHLPFLTHPFYRAAQTTTPGSGLGLALVAEILRRHQSELHIESRHRSVAAPGLIHGTCVSFTLPALWKEKSSVEA